MRQPERLHKMSKWVLKPQKIDPSRSKTSCPSALFSKKTRQDRNMERRTRNPLITRIKVISLFLMQFQIKLSLRNKIPPNLVNMVINPSPLKIVQQFNFRNAHIWLWIMIELIYRRLFFHCLLVWNLHRLGPIPWHQNWIGNEIYATRSCFKSMSWDKAFINSQIWKHYSHSDLTP